MTGETINGIRVAHQAGPIVTLGVTAHFGAPDGHVPFCDQTLYIRPAQARALAEALLRQAEAADALPC